MHGKQGIILMVASIILPLLMTNLNVTHVLCLEFLLKQAVLILFLSKEEVIEQDSTSTVEKRAEGALTSCTWVH